MVPYWNFEPPPISTKTLPPALDNIGFVRFRTDIGGVRGTSGGDGNGPSPLNALSAP